MDTNKKGNEMKKVTYMTSPSAYGCGSRKHTVTGMVVEFENKIKVITFPKNAGNWKEQNIARSQIIAIKDV